jgi:hypothetical protein
MAVASPQNPVALVATCYHFVATSLLLVASYLNIWTDPKFYFTNTPSIFRSTQVSTVRYSSAPCFVLPSTYQTVLPF